MVCSPGAGAFDDDLLLTTGGRLDGGGVMVAVTVGETAGVGASVVPRFGCGLGGVKPVASSSWGARRLSRWARSPRRAVAAASSEMSMETDDGRTRLEPARVGAAVLDPGDDDGAGGARDGLARRAAAGGEGLEHGSLRVLVV